MKKTDRKNNNCLQGALPEKFAISDEDIHAAMKDIPGYLDITAGDFRELYEYSYRHALDRLIHSVRVGEMMTEEVVTVSISTPLHEVADIMASAGISGVPVLDHNGRLAGIISERDFLAHMGAAKASFMSIIAACLRGKGCAALGIRNALAENIMSSPVISISLDAPLAEAAALLTRENINRLPVIDEQNENIIGILTRNDLVQAHAFD